MQGYCVKCRAPREMINVTRGKTSHGRLMVKGICQTCGATMNKFLSKLEASKPEH